MRRNAQQRSHLPNIDLTAMVDVVFLLIVFFLTTSSLVEQSRTPLELAEEQGEDLPPPPTPPLLINITAGGSYVVEGDEFSLDSLLVRVAQEDAESKRRNQALEVTVRADHRAAMAPVNQLATALAERGIRSWRLATQLPAAGANGGGGGGGS